MHAMKKTGKHSISPLVLTSAVLLMILNIIRVLRVPITHDEGLTHKDYMNSSFLDIISFEKVSANNHVLNTLLAKCSVAIFKDIPLFLRLDNILAQLLYMFFGYLVLSKIFKDRFIIFLGFLILNLNPFLFDFWGLCRGYGLSISFMMGSISFFIVYLVSRSGNQLKYSLAFAIASVYSNFASLNFYLALLITIPLNASFLDNSYKGLSKKEVRILILSGIVLATQIAYPIFKLKADHQLYYGGDNGFISDTIRTLVADSFFITDTNSTFVLLFSYTVAIALLWITYRSIKLYLNKPVNRQQQITLCLSLLIIIPVIATILQHYILGTKFLISRTALLFLPLFFLSLLTEHQGSKSISRYILPVIISLVSLVNFCVHLNMNTTWSWTYDRFDSDMMKRVVYESGALGRPVRLYPFWIFAPSLQYYAETRYMGKFYEIEHDKSGPRADTSFDYYYILKAQMPLMPSIYKIDTMYDDKYVLLKKR